MTMGEFECTTCREKFDTIRKLLAHQGKAKHGRFMQYPREEEIKRQISKSEILKRKKEFQEKENISRSL